MNIIAYILYIYTSIYEQLPLSGMYLSVFCGFHFRLMPEYLGLK